MNPRELEQRIAQLEQQVAALQAQLAAINAVWPQIVEVQNVTR
jgi:prefoldin subunit 5